MRYTGSLDVRCVRTCVCNPAALKAAEELHARSKGYLTPVAYDPWFHNFLHTFLCTAEHSPPRWV